METKNRTCLVIFVLVAVSLLGATFYLYFPDSSHRPLPNRAVPEEVHRESATTSSGVSVRGVEFDETPNSSPQKSTTAQSSIYVPDLDRPIVFSANVSQSQQTLITKKIEEIVAVLRKNSDAFNSWVGLGIERKAAGDYEGARDAWEYASAIRPSNSVSFGNLGDLYAYYLRDPHKAEQRFLTAVKNDPSMTYLFVQTADFYVSVLGNRSKAVAFLQQALRDNPRNQDLKKVLESYAKN